MAMAKGAITQRVAAILAADAVGYSRLMAADETATIAALDQARAIFGDSIVANHGRVVDTAGDSVLAVFETTAGAVQAAVAIQARLAEANTPLPDDRHMVFRIGIHLGDIHEKVDGTVYGDGINVAARLQSLADAGGVVVSGSVHESIRGRLGLGFGYLGEQDVKNIPEPVQAYRVLAKGEAPPATTQSKSRNSGPRLALITAAAAIILLIGGVVYWQVVHPPPETKIAESHVDQADDPILKLPTGPSIAVLPFDNLSGDPEQEYFVDGLVDNIITGLSLFPEFFVIARGSTFQYKGRALDVRDINRDLGAAYVVDGSVQRSAEGIRVTTRLHDAATGAQLWAQTYDKSLSASNVFEFQDDIRDQVAAMIAGTTGVVARHQAGEVRARRTENLASYECVLMAGAHYNEFTPASHLRARDCIEQALETDPNYAEAWAWLTYLYADEDAFGFNPRPDALDRSLEAGLRAVKLDPASAIAHSALARTHAYRQELDDFFVHTERAVELNPNNVFVVVDMGQFMTMLGRADRGSALVRKAMKLNPYHQGWYYTSERLN